MTTNPSLDQAQHTAGGFKLHTKECLAIQRAMHQECSELIWCECQITSLPSTCETARSEDVAVPREYIIEALMGSATFFNMCGRNPMSAKANAKDVATDLMDALAAALRPDARTEAEQRVLAVRGSWDAPGFDACVEAEMARGSSVATPTGDVAAKLAEIGEQLYLAFWKRNGWNEIKPFNQQAPAIVNMWNAIAADAQTSLAERAAALEQALRAAIPFVKDWQQTSSGFEVLQRIRRALGEGR